MQVNDELVSPNASNTRITTILQSVGEELAIDTLTLLVVVMLLEKLRSRDLWGLENGLVRARESGS